MQPVPNQALRQVQLQPESSVPLTAVARPKQSFALVQVREHADGYPDSPGAHSSQSEPPKVGGQVWQLAPVHEWRHLHVQVVEVLPVTDVARPLQFAAEVHGRTQVGYSPTNPAPHAEHSLSGGAA